MTLSFSCPIEAVPEKIITLAHGSGGKHTHRLIEEIFLPAFSNDALNTLHDGALLTLPKQEVIFTTDSYVIQPLFFPGGDIGKLSVIGTMNDLAMCGAKPYYISCGFIIEEGILQSELKKIVSSMQNAAFSQGVKIVTGDTKVIERQTGENLFINTSGLGVKITEDPISPKEISACDLILLSGDIGRHGMAIMAEREGLEFSLPLESDCAPLFPLVEALIHGGVEIHCLRDLTRGGLATALVELSEASNMDFNVQEEEIVISDPVNSACELLGFDPLYVANEGRFIAFIPQEHGEKALKILHSFPEGSFSKIIGKVIGPSKNPSVSIRNAFHTERFLFRLVGDQLPRIC